MTETWRDYSVEEENEKADKALGVEFTNDLRLLLEKYGAALHVEENIKTGKGEVSFYSPSRYVDNERTKANLDVCFSDNTASYDLT
jgi:hypothetical protein